MSPYILSRLEPQSPMPLLSRPYAHAWHSAGSFRVTSTTQHSIALHDHIHTSGYPKYVGRGLKFVYASTYFLIHHDVQFVHHRHTSVLFSPSPVDISVQIAQQCLLTTYGSLRQFDLWSHCRSQQYHQRTLTDYHQLLLLQITISSQSPSIKYVLHYHKSYIRHK